jgi:hypothetical protein
LILAETQPQQQAAASDIQSELHGDDSLYVKDDGDACIASRAAGSASQGTLRDTALRAKKGAQLIQVFPEEN